MPEDRLAEAVARLKALGYVEPYPDMAPGLNALAGHHVHLQGGQDLHLAVELHWTLIGGEHDWRSPSLPWFWEQTEEWSRGAREQGSKGAGELGSTGAGESPSAPPPLRTLAPLHPGPSAPLLILTPTAHLLYLCAHLMLQHGEARSLLRWFYDVYLLAGREGRNGLGLPLPGHLYGRHLYGHPSFPGLFSALTFTSVRRCQACCGGVWSLLRLAPSKLATPPPPCYAGAGDGISIGPAIQLVSSQASSGAGAESSPERCD